MHESKAVGTVIEPMWKSYFWPLLYSDGVHFNSFVVDWLYLPARPDLFVKGRAKNKLFGAKAFKVPITPKNFLARNKSLYRTEQDFEKISSFG